MDQRQEHQPPSESLDEFIESASGHGRGRRPWDSWPERMKDEIGEILKRNDTGKAAVPITAVIRRAVQVHGVDVSQTTLRRYAMEVLGRRGWRL